MLTTEALRRGLQSLNFCAGYSPDQEQIKDAPSLTAACSMWACPAVSTFLRTTSLSIGKVELRYGCGSSASFTVCRLPDLFAYGCRFSALAFALNQWPPRISLMSFRGLGASKSVYPFVDHWWTPWCCRRCQMLHFLLLRVGI